MLNKWRRLFHWSRVKLPLVNMSASWCLVSMYRICIMGSINPVKQPIQSDSMGSWYMSHCGTQAFHYHFNHGFHCPQRHTTYHWKQTVFRLMERDQHWSDRDWCSWLKLVFACLTEELPAGFFRGSLTSLFFWFGLVRNEILQSLIPKIESGNPIHA